MRAQPPPPPSRRDPEPAGERRPASPPRQRCPYLEQILRGRGGPFGVLTRFRADCHVDRRTHTWTGRHPVPPCISDPRTCALYRREHDAEDRRIQRYRD